MNRLVVPLALLVAAPASAQLATANELGVSFAHMHLSTTDLGSHPQLWAELFGGAVLEEAGYTAVEIPGALIFFTEQEPTAPSTATSASTSAPASDTAPSQL